MPLSRLARLRPSCHTTDALCWRGRPEEAAGSRTPALFGNELPEPNAGLIDSRPRRPQTRGKLERFRRSLESGIWRRGDLDDCVGFYEEGQPHLSPDTNVYETPLTAFRRKRAADGARGAEPGLKAGICG